MTEMDSLCQQCQFLLLGAGVCPLPSQLWFDGELEAEGGGGGGTKQVIGLLTAPEGFLRERLPPHFFSRASPVAVIFASTGTKSKSPGNEEQ